MPFIEPESTAGKKRKRVDATERSKKEKRTESSKLVFLSSFHVISRHVLGRKFGGGLHVYAFDLAGRINSIQFWQHAWNIPD